MTKISLRIKSWATRNLVAFRHKIKNDDGFSHTMEVIIVVVICIVVGGIVLGASTGIFTDLLNTIKTKVLDLFN